MRAGSREAVACCLVHVAGPSSFSIDADDVTLGGSFPSTSCTWRLSMKGSRIWCRRWMTTTRFSMATSSSPPAPGAVLPKLSPNHSANWFLSSNTCRHNALKPSQHNVCCQPKAAGIVHKFSCRLRGQGVQLFVPLAGRLITAYFI